MLSVVIETRNHEDALARTLASLVGGAVEGVVREVIVCDAGSSDRTHTVADHAGCHYLADAHLEAGIRQARSEWLLLLEPGARLLDGWMDAVLAHAGDATGPARFQRARQSKQPFLARILSGRRPLAEGLMITRRQALSLSQREPSAAAIAKAITARRLGAEIVVAPFSKG
ncbi:glycosyltransferase [Mesorhizobium sp. CAU 1741]|uniref:glycosyltransferase n=1 Tax=Mesorhizobium sp. CAU 1741 TaxID=3140366 RepID=UPI00325B092B